MIEINPWLKIWSSPKNTIQKIIDYDPKHRLGVLCFIYGFISCLSISQSLMLGHYYSIGFIYVLSILLAVPIGFISFSISTAFFWVAGKILKGKGDFSSIRAAIAWSNVPSFFVFVMWVILTCIYGQDIFISKSPDLNSRFFPEDFGLIVQSIVGIWGFIILIGSIAQVQKFSNWRSFGSFVIATCFWFILFLIGFSFLITSSQSSVAMMFFAS